MEKELAELNEKYGIDNTVKFIKKNGLICVVIKNKLAKSEIYLHGAHVASFIPGGQEDVLWMSQSSYFEENRPIRGGIPVCWPWFSAHPTDLGKPAHGFARLAEWDVLKTEAINDGCTQLTLGFASSDLTFQIWPYQFDLKLIITVGSKLEVELITKNTDTSPFEITTALHSYFNISDIANIAISGLENAHYLDSMDEKKEKVQDGKIQFSSEVDRIYFDTKDTCIITDPVNNREIVVGKTGSNSTVVWNPWIDKSKRMPDFGDDEYHTMVCIETANVYNDKVSLAPGATHALKAILGVK